MTMKCFRCCIFTFQTFTEETLGQNHLYFSVMISLFTISINMLHSAP